MLTSERKVIMRNIFVAAFVIIVAFISLPAAWGDTKLSKQERDRAVSTREHATSRATECPADRVER
jgi:hypothetical protein